MLSSIKALFVAKNRPSSCIATFPNTKTPGSERVISESKSVHEWQSIREHTVLKNCLAACNAATKTTKSGAVGALLPPPLAEQGARLGPVNHSLDVEQLFLAVLPSSSASCYQPHVIIQEKASGLQERVLYVACAPTDDLADAGVTRLSLLAVHNGAKNIHHFHQGYLQHAQMLPHSLFYDLLQEGFTLVFTGQGHAASVAAISATLLIMECSHSKQLAARVKFVGFGPLPYVSQGSVGSLSRLLRPGQFVNYMTAEDWRPALHLLWTQMINRLVQEKGGNCEQLASTVKHSALARALGARSWPTSRGQLEHELQQLADLSNKIIECSRGCGVNPKELGLLLSKDGLPNCPLATLMDVLFVGVKERTFSRAMLGSFKQPEVTSVFDSDNNVLKETWHMTEVHPQAWGLISSTLEMKVDVSQLHEAVQSTTVSYQTLSDLVSALDSFHPPVANGIVQAHKSGGKGEEQRIALVGNFMPPKLVSSPYGHQVDVLSSNHSLGGICSIQIVLQGNSPLLYVTSCHIFGRDGYREELIVQSSYSRQREKKTIGEEGDVLVLNGTISKRMVEEGELQLEVEGMYQGVSACMALTKVVRVDKLNYPHTAMMARMELSDLYARIFVSQLFTGKSNPMRESMESALAAQQQKLARLRSKGEVLDKFRQWVLEEEAPWEDDQEVENKALLRDVCEDVRMAVPVPGERFSDVAVGTTHHRQGVLVEIGELQEEVERGLVQGQSLCDYHQGQLDCLRDDDEEQYKLMERLMHNLKVLERHTRLVNNVLNSMMADSLGATFNTIRPDQKPGEAEDSSPAKEIQSLLSAYDEVPNKPTLFLKQAQPHLAFTAVTIALLQRERRFNFLDRVSNGANYALWACGLLAPLLAVATMPALAVGGGVCAMGMAAYNYSKLVTLLNSHMDKSKRHEGYKMCLHVLLEDLMGLGAGAAGKLKLGRILEHVYLMEEEVTKEILGGEAPSMRMRTPAEVEEQVDKYMQERLPELKGDEVVRCMLVCVCNNYHIRHALLDRVCVAIVGVSKVGKSSLVQQVFGLDSKPGGIIRTDDISMFKVRPRYLVIDFAHLDSDVDEVKKEALALHQRMLDVVIYVADSKTGGDKDNAILHRVYDTLKAKYLGERIRDEDLPMLICMNRADELLADELTKLVNMGGLKSPETKQLQREALRKWRIWKDSVVENLSKYEQQVEGAAVIPECLCRATTFVNEERRGVKEELAVLKALLGLLHHNDGTEHLNQVWRAGDVREWLHGVLETIFGESTPDIEKLWGSQAPGAPVPDGKAAQKRWAVPTLGYFDQL